LPLLGKFFQLSYVENTGAAFGQFANQTNVLTILSFLCIIILLWVIQRSHTLIERIGLVLILSGATGNFLDRIFRGVVIDFLDFEFFDIHLSPFWVFSGFDMTRWPVFNLADSYICVGTSVVILGLLRIRKQNDKYRGG